MTLKPPLPSTINTPTIEKRIRRAALAVGLKVKDTVYEHGHWWIVTQSGRFYDAADAIGPGSADGFAFEPLS